LLIALAPRVLGYHGRYAYNMQPQIGHRSCYALGQALLPLIGTVEKVQAALAGYQTDYDGKLQTLLHAKLGLRTTPAEDASLIDALFAILQKSQVSSRCSFNASAICRSSTRPLTSRREICSSTAPRSMRGPSSIACGCITKTVSMRRGRSSH